VNGLGRGVLAVTDRPSIRRLFTESAAGRRLSLRYVAGETLDDAAAAAAAINDRGARVSLDYLGEHVTQPAEAIVARDSYLDCVDRIRTARLDANLSIKLTQLGLGLDDGLAVESLARIAARANEVGTTVTVDMEESGHTEATVTAFEEVQAESGNLGIAVQSYLYRTASDLDRIIPRGGRVRLCKGAYAEPREVAYQERKRVDANFDVLLTRLMTSTGIEPAIATHDATRIAEAKRLARTRREPWEFQMLYGIRRKLQQELIDEGYPLRVYVPFGTAWYQYLTRRLAERPANLVFFVRAVIGD
jgi:proline dehydrogenase